MGCNAGDGCMYAGVCGIGETIADLQIGILRAKDRAKRSWQ